MLHMGRLVQAFALRVGTLSIASCKPLESSLLLILKTQEWNTKSSRTDTKIFRIWSRCVRCSSALVPACNIRYPARGCFVRGANGVEGINHSYRLICMCMQEELHCTDSTTESQFDCSKPEEGLIHPRYATTRTSPQHATKRIVERKNLTPCCSTGMIGEEAVIMFKRVEPCI